MMVYDGWPWSEDQSTMGSMGPASGRPGWNDPNASSADREECQGGLKQHAQSTMQAQSGKKCQSSA
jgi:hypothetical protein